MVNGSAIGNSSSSSVHKYPHFRFPSSFVTLPTSNRERIVFASHSRSFVSSSSKASMRASSIPPLFTINTLNGRTDFRSCSFSSSTLFLRSSKRKLIFKYSSMTRQSSLWKYSFASFSRSAGSKSSKTLNDAFVSPIFSSHI